MYITDNSGKQIKVSDLDAAIKQVEVFVNYAHEDTDFKIYDKELRAYWLDIQQKLWEAKQAPAKTLFLPVNTKPNKEQWIADFLGSKEEVTDEEEIINFLHSYAASSDWEPLPDVLYVFEGGYFISMKEGVFRTNYNDSVRQYDTLAEAEQYLSELEWQDSTGELHIILDPSNTLIEAVRTDYTGGNIYNDVIVLKDGTTIRISEGVIAVFKEQKENTPLGEIFY